MLFVRPGVQGRGLGRALLASAMPEPTRGRRIGRPGGRPRRTASSRSRTGCTGRSGWCRASRSSGWSACRTAARRSGRCPPAWRRSAFDEVPDGPDGLGRAALAAELAALDRDAAGFDRSADHAFHAREGRVGFLFRDRSGRRGRLRLHVARPAGSARSRSATAPSRAGAGPPRRRAVRPRGAFGIWVPGTAGEAVVPLLRAGFRFDGFPVLLCWDRPFADFSRFVPMSPGLL